MHIIHTPYMYALYGCLLGMHSMFVPIFVVITEVVCVRYYICIIHMSTTHAKDVHSGMDKDDSEKIEGKTDT